MKYKELKNLTEEQLQKKKEEATMELIKLNAQVSTGTPPENPGQIKKLRRTIARINTKLQND